MNYRREIDGARAIAVLLVILFHAGFETFSGGFVGVDVFFVISGYLITSIILADLDKGRFSVIEFYERRARRILPALFLVMLVCIPFAWLWLPSGEMKEFSLSMAAVSVFGSNFLFWNESGYFETDATLKPLLHTWSLSVEEQYYILFPCFMILCSRRGKQWLVILLAVAGAASLLLAHRASLVRSSAGFYLLPYRGWELVIGALAAVYLSRDGRVEFGRVTREVAGWLGMVLILVSALTYSQATPFPGLYALLPTIGALLIIVFATKQTTVGELMGTKVLVGIGLVSYSAYLWHHVLFAFARHNSLREPSSFVFAVLAVFTLFLAYLSWRFVETPFRTKARFSRKAVFGFSIFGMLFFFGFGSLGHRQNGFAKHANEQQALRVKRTERNFVVLGDSHGAHLISGLKAITSGHVEDATHNGCIPFRNVDRYDYRFAPGTCAAWVNGHLDRIVAKDPNATLILSSMGPVYIDGTPFQGKGDARVTGLGVELISDRSVKDRAQVFEIGLRSTLTELSRLRNVRVVIAIDIPELGIENGCSKEAKEIKVGNFSLGDAVVSTVAEECFVSRRSYDQRAAAYKALVTRVAAEFPEVLVFDPTSAFCDGLKCKGVDQELGFLYKDVDHLSEAGSWYFATRLMAFLGAT